MKSQYFYKSEKWLNTVMTLKTVPTIILKADFIFSIIFYENKAIYI